MPLTPQQRVGKNLIQIGNKEIATSKKLRSAAISLAQVSELSKANGKVDTSMVSIEAGTRSTRDLMTPVASALHFVANKLDDITVPHIDINTRRINFPVVGRVTFVTSVSVNSKHPFHNIAGKITDVADDIDNVAKALKSIADGLKDLNKQLPDFKKNLRQGSLDGQDAAANLNDAGTLMVTTGGFLFP
jgi:hypothetical protein